MPVTQDQARALAQLALAVLEEHRRIETGARWNGSPDPTNWRNIVRRCSCGERLSEWPWRSRDPQEARRHREHVAEAVVAALTAGGGVTCP